MGKMPHQSMVLKNALKFMDNENINLKISSFLWQGNLPNRASKINRLLACQDIHLPRA